MPATEAICSDKQRSYPYEATTQKKKNQIPGKNESNAVAEAR